ncbi:Phosphoinositide phosphatase [Arachis hypogaea]|nr:Phosphoinositide phosphatase [Arachis hypogaea]
MDIEPSLVGSAERFKLDHELELHEFEDKFVIKSLQSPNQGFWISRRDGNINFLDDEICSGSPSRTSTIYGVVGTIRLVVGTYVVVITSCKEVGSFLGYPVYRVMSMRVLACNDALKFSTGQEKKDEAYFMTLLNIVESTPGLYYSYETDITLNLQRRNKLVEGWMSKPLWKQADPRYIWNRHLSEELIEWHVPLTLNVFVVAAGQIHRAHNTRKYPSFTFHVYVSFQVAELKLKDSLAMVTLVSRRCNRRLGTRMWRRGANLEGDAANFIETEQLLETERFRSSFLQVRGSIPLLWEQIVDLSYKPHLSVIKHEQTPLVVERHFSDLSQRYGEIIAIDLTEKHGEEGQLSAAYAAEMKNVPNVRYVPFDFHGHCKDSNFDNLEILYDQISEDAEKQRYFLIDREGNVLEEQKGVIRSNCVDSLDRTNVTQCYLAQKALNLQLQRIGVLSPSECISMFDEEYGKYRALWAEQGDEISLEYTGTHALKGDIVRYGKQTIFGMIKDGMSALSRYYLNNFHDGIRQDALDLISGHYTVNRNSLSPIGQNGFDPFSHNLNAVSGNTLCLTSTNTSIEYDTFLPVTSALIIGGLTATTLTVQQVGRNVHQYVSTAICAGITAGVMAILKANGRQFCSRPRLCGLL